VIKKEFVEVLSKRLQETKKRTDEIVDDFLGQIVESVNETGLVKFVGFGNFEAKDVPARTCRNPKTGESVEVKSKRKVLFKVGKEFKDSLNG